MSLKTLHELSTRAHYSLLENLSADPDAVSDGRDHEAREVFSGHYVPVRPEPISNPRYVAHSQSLFEELGWSEELATSPEFIQMFSGDLSVVPSALRDHGWATGYALSIYGDEYYQQCPFATGNGYGDGRAISILEGVFQGQRWEFQLKGGGRTPYCRGADGRAVLRSSVREFLVQEHMKALGVPTSRSLSLITSKTETVHRPWFREGSSSKDPEVMITEPVAISTRVAPSFLRVGQLELFGRRARKKEHPKALQELEAIVLHVIDREYGELKDDHLSLFEKVLMLAKAFRDRLTSLVADWIRVGYCQGNFNSDNCAVGGFTLDYGPFGFMDDFDPGYQPWTHGGMHFAFFNQPHAAEQNYRMFCMALRPLLESDEASIEKLDDLLKGFSGLMQEKFKAMFAAKLGLHQFNAEIYNELVDYMVKTPVDYTLFFRELSKVPETIEPLLLSHYGEALSDDVLERLTQWHQNWLSAIQGANPSGSHASTEASRQALSARMLKLNPKYTLREWHLVPAYRQAEAGEDALIKELQSVMSHPYEEQSDEIEKKYYGKKPLELFHKAGVSHVSCSS